MTAEDSEASAVPSSHVVAPSEAVGCSISDPRRTANSHFLVDKKCLADHKDRSSIRGTVLCHDAEQQQQPPFLVLVFG